MFVWLFACAYGLACNDGVRGCGKKGHGKITLKSGCLGGKQTMKCKDLVCMPDILCSENENGGVRLLFDFLLSSDRNVPFDRKECKVVDETCVDVCYLCDVLAALRKKGEVDSRILAYILKRLIHYVDSKGNVRDTLYIPCKLRTLMMNGKSVFGCLCCKMAKNPILKRVVLQFLCKMKNELAHHVPDNLCKPREHIKPRPIFSVNEDNCNLGCVNVQNIEDNKNVRCFEDEDRMRCCEEYDEEHFHDTIRVHDLTVLALYETVVELTKQVKKCASFVPFTPYDESTVMLLRYHKSGSSGDKNVVFWNFDRLAAQYVNGTPISGQPSSGQSSSGTSGTGKPSTSQPSGGQTSSGQPSSGTPSSGQTSSGTPSSGQPSSSTPSSGQPSSSTPSSGQPSSGTPSSGQTSSGQPSSGTPSSGQTSSGTPSSGQPSSSTPSSGQPSSSTPSSGQPSSGTPSSGQTSSGQPSSGTPSSGQPSSGQPSSSTPSSGQPASGVSGNVKSASSASGSEQPANGVSGNGKPASSTSESGNTQNQNGATGTSTGKNEGDQTKKKSGADTGVSSSTADESAKVTAGQDDKGQASSVQDASMAAVGGQGHTSPVRNTSTDDEKDDEPSIELAHGS